MPRLPAEYATWMGRIKTCEEIKESYQVDDVFFADEIGQQLREMNSSGTLLLLNGTNTDSGKQTRTAAFDGIAKFTTDDTILHHEMSDLRYANNLVSQVEIQSIFVI